jgi:hypothetical protein
VIEAGFWNVEGWPEPEEWSALWAFLGFLVTLGAATAALLQLRAYLQDRAAQARPYVVVDFSFDSFLMRIEVKNISATLASNVRLSVNTPFRSTLPDVPPVLAKVMGPSYVIRQLAPQRAMLWTLDSAPQYAAAADFPQVYEVTARYDDPRLLRRDRPWQVWRPALPATYEDTFELSFDQWIDTSIATDYSKKAADALAEIAKKVKAR